MTRRRRGYSTRKELSDQTKTNNGNEQQIQDIESKRPSKRRRTTEVPLPLSDDDRIANEQVQQLMQLVKQELSHDVQCLIVQFHHSPLVSIDCFPENREEEVGHVIRSTFIYFNSDPHRTRYLLATKFRLIVDFPVPQQEQQQHPEQVQQYQTNNNDWEQDMLLILPLHTEIILIDTTRVDNVNEHSLWQLKQLFREVIPKACERMCNRLKSIEVWAKHFITFTHLLLNKELDDFWIKPLFDLYALSRDFHASVGSIEVHPFYKGKLRHYSAKESFRSITTKELYPVFLNAFPELQSLMTPDIPFEVFRESSSALFKNIRRFSLKSRNYPYYTLIDMDMPKLHTLYLDMGTWRHNHNFNGIQRHTALKNLSITGWEHLKESAVKNILELPMIERLAVCQVENWKDFFKSLREKSSITDLALSAIKQISYSDAMELNECKSLVKLSIRLSSYAEKPSSLYSALSSNIYIQTMDIEVMDEDHIAILLQCRNMRYLTMRATFDYDQAIVLNQCKDTIRKKCKETRLRTVRIINNALTEDEPMRALIKGIEFYL